MKTSSRLIALAAAAILAFFSGSVHAQTIFWTGANGANWSGDGLGGQNWSSTAESPGVATTPVNGNSLRWFGASGNTNQLTSNNDIDNLSVAGISFQGADKAYTLNGNKLTMTGSFTQPGAFSHTINLPLELNNNINIEGSSGENVLTFNGNITETGGNRTVNVQSGTVALNGANSYTGNMILGVSANATVSINTLANITSAQSLGQGALIQLGHTSSNGTIIYNGSAIAATDKGFQIGRSATASTGNGSFINNGIGVVTWNGAQTKATANDQALTFTLGGSNTGDNTWQSAIENNSATGTIGVTKEGAGTLILGGTNLYTGATTVSEGTLLVNGSTAAGSAVSVAANAVIGGDGTINGNLTLANGALFAFDTTDTLDLGGTLTLDASFGVASLRNTSGGAIDWSSIGNATYTLISGASLPTFTTSNITNFGSDSAFDIGGGRSAYFTNGSLALVVIPEPSTWALLSGSLAAFAIFRRRFKRS